MEESNLTKHAQTELEKAGLFKEDSDYGGMVGDAVISLVRTFSEQGHSGFSAHMTLDIFGRVASFKNLVPLTDAPDEWMDVAEYSDGSEMWQSRRRSSCFSTDGGKTYYDIDERPLLWRRIVRRLPGVSVYPRGRMHASEPASA